MGASKIPIYVYVDESGNTGKNIFDEAQPDFFTAALVSKGDFDLRWGGQVSDIAKKLGVDVLHANQLGLGRLETIADDLHSLLNSAGAHFFVSRVEKRYLLATKMFDVLFDSGENAAVPWHVYNIRPLKIMLAFKLAEVINDKIAKDFWKCLLLPNEAKSREALPGICSALKAQLHILPDERSRELLGAGLDWIIQHPESIHFATEQKIAKQGHFPNLVAFANLLRGLQTFSERWKKKIRRITHDEQSEFGLMLQTWHEMFSNASPDVIEWAGESYSLQMAPGSDFVISTDEKSAGIQIADLALWLYAQALKGKDLPEACAKLLYFILQRGWHDDFSFAGVEKQLMEKWGEVFFGPMDDEKIEAGRKLLQLSEERRVASMVQYEQDGVAPFMRGLATDRLSVNDPEQSAQ
ncbi:DUF3800 domain-containing protein [Bradyrhizobium sp.]|uniref:DUF3800 domain-containing protein n=1 Tax=Bradyrhizobium sp. TaxID=376 RepID=UPI0039E6598D